MKKFLLFLLLLAAGCSKPETPEWYVNTPKDTPLYFYASSEGYSKQNALKKALNDIASRINVKISSSFVINKGIHNKKTYNEIYQQINTQIKNIDFNNYKILKTKKEDGKYYVLIRIDKSKLLKNLKYKINMKISSLNLEADTPIKKVIKAYKLLKEIKIIKSRIFILESLGEPIGKYIKTLQRYQKKAENTILTTKFKLKTDKYRIQTLEALSKYLSISNDSKNIIKINIKTKNLTLLNYYLIKGKAVIILDRPYTVTFLGKSSSGFTEAENFAKKEYYNRLLALLKNIF